MILYQFDIHKSKLCTIPEKERIFFVQIMNFMNEMHTFQKLSFIAGENVEQSYDVVKSAQVSQALFLTKILTLKLFEGWKLIKRELLKDGNLPVEILQDFEKIKANKKTTAEAVSSIKEGLECFDKLKTYLEQPIPKNRIKLVRDWFAAHYSKEASVEIGRLIGGIPESKIYQLYFSEAHGNCFYKMAHDLSNEAMLELLSKAEPRDNKNHPMIDFMEDVKNVVRWFLEFTGSYIMVVMIKNFGFEHTVVELPEPLALDEVELPYFVGDLGKKRVSSTAKLKQRTE